MKIIIPLFCKAHGSNNEKLFWGILQKQYLEEKIVLSSEGCGSFGGKENLEDLDNSMGIKILNVNPSNTLFVALLRKMNLAWQVIGVARQTHRQRTVEGRALDTLAFQAECSRQKKWHCGGG